VLLSSMAEDNDHLAVDFNVEEDDDDDHENNNDDVNNNDNDNNNNNLIDMDDEDEDDLNDNGTTLDGGVAVDGHSSGASRQSSAECDLVRTARYSFYAMMDVGVKVSGHHIRNSLRCSFCIACPKLSPQQTMLIFF
jgi:hypothetical protein